MKLKVTVLPSGKFINLSLYSIRNNWSMAKVIDTMKDENENVRIVKLFVGSVRKIYERPVNIIALLIAVNN